MKITSTQVGLPREVFWQGRSVTTGIFKEPVTGPVMVRTLGLDGDGQADLSVHGGPDKAVYAYPVEHYVYWRQELPGRTLANGMFGENLTTEGLLEKEVNIGHRFRVGGLNSWSRSRVCPATNWRSNSDGQTFSSGFSPAAGADSILRSCGKARCKPETGSNGSVAMAMALVLKTSYACTPLSETIWKRCGVPCGTRRCQKAGAVISDINLKNTVLRLGDKGVNDSISDRR